LTSRAQRQVVKILEQVLLFECPLKCLVQRLLRPQDQIQQESRHKKQDDQQGGENLGKDASAPGLDITKGPGDECKPKGYEVGDCNRQQKLHTSCGGLDHERCPLSEPMKSIITAKLSVPDALETPDWKHEYAGTAGALLNWTWDPELCQAPSRAQRLNSSGASTGPRTHER
jgi:hypothetical protein